MVPFQHLFNSSYYYFSDIGFLLQEFYFVFIFSSLLEKQKGAYLVFDNVFYFYFLVFVLDLLLLKNYIIFKTQNQNNNNNNSQGEYEKLIF